MARPPGYLLDTNILIHLLRGKALGEAIDRDYGLRSAMSHCVICVVTVGEVLSLARSRNWGEPKMQELKSLLDELVEVDINHPAILDAYAEIDSESVRLGRPMGKNDVWIAAVAKVSGMTLLTTDRDFDHLQGTHIDRVWINPEADSAPC